MDGAQHREVLERHLRRPVLADRDAGVRAARGGCSPARSPPCGRSRRRARGTPRTSRRTAPSRAPHPDRRGDHLLLGDEHLEVAVRVRLAEHLGVGRVADLGVERHHVAAARAERLERVAVGLARRLLLAELPRRPRWQRLPGVVRHVFTHFPLELTVLLAKVSRSTPAPGGMRWTARRDLHEEALPGVMKKVLAHALGDLPAVGPKVAGPNAPGSKAAGSKAGSKAAGSRSGPKARGPAPAGEE